MKRAIAQFGGIFIATFLALTGCTLREPAIDFGGDTSLQQAFNQTSPPDIPWDNVDTLGSSYQPFSLTQNRAEQYWDLSLEGAIQLALQHSRVFRDLGGTVIQTPGALRTVHGPSIVETNPQFGVQAALAAFDAQLLANMIFENNDRALNNELVGGGTRLFKQDLGSFQGQITKRTGTGTEFTLRKNVEYDANNSPRNLFSSAWNVDLEAEFRHPLLQGNGSEFNQIAGPHATVGSINGVRVARMNTDISLANFELGLRDLISNVENAYWDLYFAYRDLDAKIQARDQALELWREVEAQKSLPGGIAEREAQAREQYYRFDLDVHDALSGRPVDGTQTNNGSSAGTFRGNPGVYTAERRLRLIMGLPINDNRLIRPSEEPVLAKVIFDWDEVASESLARRTELRRQRVQVRRTELELLANRNFLLPRIDAFGRYRFRGFGHDLISTSRDGKPRFANAFMDLTSGDFQEGQLGLEMAFPIGFRRAHAAVRHSQLQLVRERAVLQEQERHVIFAISNALAELDRAQEAVKKAMNRRLAANEQLDVLNTKKQDGISVDITLLLDAQRRKADAEMRYVRALVEQSIAIKNVHFEKGTLLRYSNVYLTEYLQQVPQPVDFELIPPPNSAPQPSGPDHELPPGSQDQAAGSLHP